jgi:hypothetical protein
VKDVPSRLLGLATAVAGAMLVTRPDKVSERLAPGAAVPPAMIVRILGVRSSVQGLVVMAIPHPVVLATAATVDGLHAGSMYLLAAADARYRRAALTSAAVASISCAVHLLAHGARQQTDGRRS